MSSTTLRTAAAALVSTALLASSPALAEVGPVNKSFFGTAVEGYDVVAYYALGRPVEGSSTYTHKWKGATWHFSSAKHRDLFAANPEKYAPQYGGYCAYAVSQGATAGIDPDAWKIVDGRLYLNLNKDIQARWMKDISGYVARANANWPGLSGDSATYASNPCNPCAGKVTHNPCSPARLNPCAAKRPNPCSGKLNPCNPCSARTANPCNPCAAYRSNPGNPCAH